MYKRQEVGRIHEQMPIKLTIGALQNLTFNAILEYISTKGVETNGANHRFDPTGHSAIWIWNRFTNYLQQQKGSGMLRIAIWVIGILSLIHILHIKDGIIERIEDNIDHDASPFGKDGIMK